MPKSNYLGNALINHVLRNTQYSPPSTVYLGLSTADPLADASGLAEPSGNGYSRLTVSFNAPTNKATESSTSKTFTASGAGWGTITHVAIFDSPSGGNMLYYRVLSTPITIADGENFVISAGDLDVQEN